MIQITIWILCVYLILKGKELQYLASSSRDDVRDILIKNAKFWSNVAFVAAFVFFVISIAQGNSMPSDLLR
jgi:hypothetical protein